MVALAAAALWLAVRTMPCDGIDGMATAVTREGEKAAGDKP